MDSGLGSDEDRRGRTKEQKQLRNQQLLSGCFIDAASLSDDGDVVTAQRRSNDDRRQPSTSGVQYSSSASSLAYQETTTPYNSIVALGDETNGRKSPLGFYVDLSDIVEPKPKTPPATAAKKNIFSMVIDFDAPRRERPKPRLSSSLVCYRKNKQTKQLSLRPEACGGGGSPSSSLSSSSSAAGPSRPVERPHDSESSSSNEDVKDVQENPAGFEELRDDKVVEVKVTEKVARSEKDEEVQAMPQFVKLSDLECQPKPRPEVNFTPRMSKSIPESSWVESPLLMSRSAGYRVAPHPLEPETDDLSDSGSATDTSMSQPKKSVRRLGTDLLRMFLEEIGPDVTVEVDGHRLKAHKCILASRCQYFAALLSGNWLEASGNVISLQGFSYESVYFALCHIYSGAAHVPDSISLVELASLADMLGLEGLKEVVEHALKQRHCHSFHKPCAGCCLGVLEVLPLSAAYGLDDLYQKCLHWVTQHFVRVWPSRAFAGLPRELRDKCYQQHVVHMTPDKVLDTMAACDKVLATLPALRWADPVTQLVLQLIDACRLYHLQHFSAVLAAPSFQALDSGLGWSVGQVEDQLISMAGSLNVEQACRSYARCCKMLEQTWSRPFTDLLYKLKLQLEQCLVKQSDRLIRSNAWLRLDSALRCRIKELMPSIEPVSRLPRATPKRTKKFPSATSTQSPAPSSTDSSQNSSPGLNQTRMHNSMGSPSLRRSLLLAARQPQVPPSPSVHRRTSTLTQPTQSSAAKMTPSRTVRQTQPQPPPKKPTQRVSPQLVQKDQPRRTNGVVVQSTVTRKKVDTAPPKLNRSISPMKNEELRSPKRNLSRVTSPRDVKTPSPKKAVASPKKAVVSPKKAVISPKRAAKHDVVPESKPPAMQRSSTFLKDEPTVLKLVK